MDREKLFKENENLVHFVIHKYFKNFKNKEDLIQEGYLGLLKAIDTFQSDRNIQFSTYATKCILNEIYGYNMKNQPIKIPNIRNHKDVVINILPLDSKFGAGENEDKDLTLQDRLEGKNNIEEFINTDFINGTIDNFIDKIQNKKHRELFKDFIENMRITGRRDTEYLARKYNLSKCSVTVIIADNLYKLRKELDYEQK